jgi:hypothetical protein
VQYLRGLLVLFPLAVTISCGGGSPSAVFSGSDAGADQAAPPQDDASEPDATGSGVDGPDDVVTKVPDSGGHPGDAAPGDGSGADTEAPSYSVSCGMTTTCEAPAQFCCLSGLPATPTCACESDSTSCGGVADAQIYCTSSAQCAAGQVCCGHVLSPAVLSCQPTCNGANDYVFCDPSAPNDCPQGHKCVASTRIVGYDRCN